MELTGRKPILCLDFDGVCHSYTSGWKGAAVIPDPPVPGLFAFLSEASQVFEVNIFSSRSGQAGGVMAMMKWFVAHAPEDFNVTLLKFPDEKPPAFVGIDDRVLTFQGEWPSVASLQAFKTWNAKEV
jgi:hypothetical protein